MNDFAVKVKQSVMLREDGAHDQADEVLTNALRRFDPKFPRELLEGILTAAAEVVARPDRFDGVSARLTQALEAMDFRSADEHTWLLLSHVLMQHRFFVSSGLARDYARRAALLFAVSPQGERGFRAQLRAMQASLDLGDFELAQYFRAKLGSDDRLGCTDPKM